MRNDFVGLINRINTAKERISEAEFRLKEITQRSKEHKKSRAWQDQHNRISKSYSAILKSNICLTGISDKREKWEWRNI